MFGCVLLAQPPFVHVWVAPARSTLPSANHYFYIWWSHQEISRKAMQSFNGRIKICINTKSKIQFLLQSVFCSFMKIILNFNWRPPRPHPQKSTQTKNINNNTNQLSEIKLTESQPTWCFRFRVQELCESRGGRPGLSVLMSHTVSVDVKHGVRVPCLCVHILSFYATRWPVLP